MTADDATTTLREALADTILDAIPDHTAWQDALLAADAILASLVEHRDDVLDVLGMEQVGRHWTNTPECEAAWGSGGDGYERYEHKPGCTSEPVYAFRPKEQP